MRIRKGFKYPLGKSESKPSTTRSRARNMATKRLFHARGCKRSRRVSKHCSNKQVLDKLEALRSLIPRYHDDVQIERNEIVKTEQLFQETADYIIVLKTQAFVLQKLIEFYEGGDGSRNEKKQIVQEDQS